MFLELDRPGTLEQLRRVLHGFAMPAVHLLSESRQRLVQIKSLNVFDEVTYMDEVYQPVLDALGVQRRELRRVVTVGAARPAPVTGPRRLHWQKKKIY